MRFKLLILTLLTTWSAADGQHFTPAYNGNPFQPMTIYVIDAQIDNQPLTAGDEIGIFDGDLCVGATTVTEAITMESPAQLVASGNDGSGNGFISNHEIMFKLWDKDQSIEYKTSVKYYDVSSGAETDPVPFSTLGQTAVSLIGIDQPDILIEPVALDFDSVVIGKFGELPLTITNQGAAVLEVSSLTTSGSGFSIVENITSLALEADSAATLTIRFTPQEARQYSETLTIISNDPDEATLNINLLGVGGISFMDQLVIEPNLLNFDSVSIGELKELIVSITNNSSISLQLDSLSISGFNAADFTIKSAASLLTLSAGRISEIIIQFTPNTVGEKSALVSFYINQVYFSIQLNGLGLKAPGYFKPAYSGNPYQPMNIFVIGAQINGAALHPGDEVGIFDGELCVGCGVVTGELSFAASLQINASKNDGAGNGFTEGHNMSFHIWDASQKTEYSATMKFYNPETGAESAPATFKSFGLAAVSLTSDEQLADINTSNTAKPSTPQLMQNYPNPFNQHTIIDYYLPQQDIVEIQIFNVKGELIRHIEQGIKDAGAHTFIWDSRNQQGKLTSSGVYIYCLKTRFFTLSKKLIYMK